MASYILILLLVVGVVWGESVSHVSFSFGDQEPISYEVRPDSHYPHTPSTRKHAPPSHDSSREAYDTRTTTTTTTTTTKAPVFYAPTTTTTKAPVFYSPIYEPTTPKPIHYKPQPSYHKARPSYHKPAPVYYPRPSYRPSYHPAPSHKHHEPEVPACAELSNSTYCLEDEKYPKYEIKSAIQYHLDKFNSLYADVGDLDTEASVERPESLEEETYLCSSATSYIRPLRAKNTDGKWRVIVNDIELHYKTFTQTTRVEECLTAGEECPKVPICYESTCLQKSIYHRFLVYDPYDHYFPFAIDTFKLPASCACLLGAYTIDY